MHEQTALDMLRPCTSGGGSDASMLQTGDGGSGGGWVTEMGVEKARKFRLECLSIWLPDFFFAKSRNLSSPLVAANAAHAIVVQFKHLEPGHKPETRIQSIDGIMAQIQQS